MMYPSPQLFRVLTISVYHCVLYEVVSCCCFIIRSSMQEILNDFPVISLTQKLIILSFIVQASLLRPRSPKARQFAVFVPSLRIYLQKKV